MIEMLEQLNWQVPDYLVVPGGNLGNSSAFGKAFIELKKFGFIERTPRIVIVQAAGANPLAQMWESGASELHAVAEPRDGGDGDPNWQSALVEEVAARRAFHERLCAGRDRRGDWRGEGLDWARRHWLRTGIGDHAGGDSQAYASGQDGSRMRRWLLF